MTLLLVKMLGSAKKDLKSIKIGNFSSKKYHIQAACFKP